MDFYKTNIPIIDLENTTPEGDAMLRPGGVEFGAVPRDYSVQPQEMFASPTEMKQIPESDWDAYYDEQEAQKSSLEHLYLSGPDGGPVFPNLDQNGDGYCWAYSTAHAVMMDRLRRNLPYRRLNPHSVAAIIKKGENEGGWCGLSAQFMKENGCALEGSTAGTWPLHSRDLKYNTPELRAVMKQYRIDEDWYDLTKQVYNQSLTQQQVATCLFQNTPVPSDFNWWGHSVCSIRKVRLERGSWGLMILNSWKNWGRHGLAVLRGSQAIPNGAVAIRSTTSHN